MRLLDRYIAGSLARPFLGTAAVIVLLLSLENSRRLMGQIEHVERPLSVLLELLAYLVPEYLGMGLLIALFVAVALAFRSLALKGELDILMSVGLSPRRLLRVPLLLGLLVALFHAGLRGYIQPVGEQRLDALGSAIAVGNLGMTITAGEFLHPDRATVLRVDDIDAPSGAFVGLFVQRENMTIFARYGRATNGGDGGMILRLFDGDLVFDGDPPEKFSSFASMVLPLQTARLKPMRLTTRHSNDRLTLDALWERAARDRSTAASRAARAGLGNRMATAAFIVIIPLFGFALGVPPKRSTSAIGLGLGILLIVGFVQAMGAIEDAARPFAPLLQLLVLLAFSMVALAMLHSHLTRGPGAVEAWLMARIRPLRRRVQSSMGVNPSGKLQAAA